MISSNNICENKIDYISAEAVDSNTHEPVACNVCYRHCKPAEGVLGACRARRMVNGEMVCDNYGKITSLALDPIEKKPLNRFYPGSNILSVGSYGCSLSCKFCQNHSIAMAGPSCSSSASVDESLYEISYSGASSSGKTGRNNESAWPVVSTEYLPPEKLVDLAETLVTRGNIGVAFTYNEPLVSWEYVRDAGRLLHEKGLKVVMVSNGMASTEVLGEIAPYVDAMNIDLKSFNPEFYREICGGDLEMVKAFISEAVKTCHVEITTLVIPGENDSDEEMREIAQWIAGLDANPEYYTDDAPATDAYNKESSCSGKLIPLHVSRFFPMYKMQDKAPTDVSRVYRLAAIAREYLNYVYTGNC